MTSGARSKEHFDRDVEEAAAEVFEIPKFKIRLRISISLKRNVLAGISPMSGQYVRRTFSPFNDTFISMVFLNMIITSRLSKLKTFVTEHNMVQYDSKYQGSAFRIVFCVTNIIKKAFIS